MVLSLIKQRYESSWIQKSKKHKTTTPFKNNPAAPDTIFKSISVSKPNCVGKNHLLNSHSMKSSISCPPFSDGLKKQLVMQRKQRAAHGKINWQWILPQQKLNLVFVEEKHNIHLHRPTQQLNNACTQTITCIICSISVNCTLAFL